MHVVDTSCRVIGSSGLPKRSSRLGMDGCQQLQQWGCRAADGPEVPRYPRSGLLELQKLARNSARREQDVRADEQLILIAVGYCSVRTKEKRIQILNQHPNFILLYFTIPRHLVFAVNFGSQRRV